MLAFIVLTILSRVFAPSLLSMSCSRKPSTGSYGPSPRLRWFSLCVALRRQCSLSNCCCWSLLCDSRSSRSARMAPARLDASCRMSRASFHQSPDCVWITDVARMRSLAACASSEVSWGVPPSAPPSRGRTATGAGLPAAGCSAGPCARHPAEAIGGWRPAVGTSVSVVRPGLTSARRADGARGSPPAHVMGIPRAIRTRQSP
mmetsp:Transcript_83125/g.235789  ORF Transcript_83125/g.235789 Transcript_83125/m.235789 type:complete len:203 (+) Transcript_83125:3141-3749(+)